MQTSMSGRLKSASRRPLRAKLIFNAGSGRPEDSPQQLVSILSEMQDQRILPKVHIVRPDSQLERVVQDAIKTGIKLIVVAGGDGTIDSVVGALVGLTPIYVGAHYPRDVIAGVVLGSVWGILAVLLDSTGS